MEAQAALKAKIIADYATLEQAPLVVQEDFRKHGQRHRALYLRRAKAKFQEIKAKYFVDARQGKHLDADQGGHAEVEADSNDATPEELNTMGLVDDIDTLVEVRQ